MLKCIDSHLYEYSIEIIGYGIPAFKQKPKHTHRNKMSTTTSSKHRYGQSHNCFYKMRETDNEHMTEFKYTHTHNY